jgi:hypothetical protein
MDDLAKRSLCGFDRIRASGWNITLASSVHQAWPHVRNGSSPAIALIRPAIADHTFSSAESAEPSTGHSLYLLKYFVFRGILVIPWTPELPHRLKVDDRMIREMEQASRQTAFSSPAGTCMLEMLEAALTAPAPSDYS